MSPRSDRMAEAPDRLPAANAGMYAQDGCQKLGECWVKEIYSYPINLNQNYF